MALNLFLENDVPDDLRVRASELDDNARELPDYVAPSWSSRMKV